MEQEQLISGSSAAGEDGRLQYVLCMFASCRWRNVCFLLDCFTQVSTASFFFSFRGTIHDVGIGFEVRIN